MSRVCSVDVWMLTFLSTLLAFSYGGNLASVSQHWLGWPITISLCSAVISLLSLEIAAPRLPTPESIKGARRLALYITAFIIGVILNYAITPVAIGSRGFRIAIFLIFGLPFFVWLLNHVRQHQATARLILGICTFVLGATYLAAALLSPTQ
jgi:MFS family permease